MAMHHRPWPLAAGIATAVAGAVLVAFGGHVPPVVSGLAVMFAALLELAAGAALTRRGGPGMAHVFAGVFALSLVSFIGGTALFDGLVVSPPPIAGMLGVFCFINGLFRGLDAVIDRPRALLPECVDAAVTFAIGVTLLFTWRSASPSVVAVASGIELLVGGAVLAASAITWARAPDAPAYEGRADTLDRLGRRLNEPVWPNGPNDVD